MNNRIKQALEQPAQQEPERVKFERHWQKTRGEKKSSRELPRHPLQPQTYIQDSANRHWVTWQAAVRSVAPPAQQEPVAWAWRAFDPDDGHYGKWGAWNLTDCKPARPLGKWFQVVSLPDSAPQPAQRKPLTDEQKRSLVTNWFAEDWAIKSALGMLEDYEAAHGIKE